MKKKMIALFAAGCVSAPFVASQVHAEAAMPETMAKFVEYHLDGNDFGEWVNHGTTREMWAGIPAGIDYSDRSAFKLSEDRSQMTRSYTMTTTGGKVISTGTSVTYWDEKLGQPVSANSGFDMGKPYSGTSTLDGMTEDTITWKYTETSQGKTTNYLVSTKRVDFNTHTKTVKKADGSGSPWESTITRVNSLKEAIAGFDLIGTWKRTLENGDTLTTVHSWGPGQRTIESRGSRTTSDGKTTQENFGLYFWDPVGKSVMFSFHDSTGFITEALLVSSIGSGGKPVMVWWCDCVTSSGTPMTMVAKRTYNKDERSIVFNNITRDGKPWAPSWGGVAFTSNRVKN